MKQICFSFLALISLTSTCFALNQEDHKAINQVIEHFTDVWNHRAGHGTADFYGQDADFVNIFGMAFAGKEEIERRHLKIHETILKGSTFEVINIRLREAKPDVVIAHVYWKVTNPGKDNTNQVMNGIFTHVFLKTQDKWEITATQNTVIP